MPSMEHLRRSLRFGRARLNASLAILPVRKTGGRGLGTIGVAENCVAVPFPAVRHVTYWLDRPQPAPGWGRFSESEITWLSGGALGFRHPSEGHRFLSEGAIAGSRSERRGKIRTDTGGEWNSRDWASVCSSWATDEESKMPVLLLWAVPAVIVVGGVGYYLVRAVH